ncbi:transcriptional regulator [Clostridium sporogenes]|jgi:transcriptional regulator with XRE-family HTH domain|uniref:Transcriptional regulator n=2 Tax=Clostridium TaxID=1485 RepID=A0AAE5C8G9_CLOSG|nr:MULTISPECIES: helix-turn-helix transcriptional regulator [Clostridium]MBE6077113.1 helix-turn-helix transcriptional regulator [Clostridium lundense]MDU2834336.1 helix-turn-helix transcriptional regulator [Clostridium botulinum]EDU38583.1 DNA-binding helix-turn-helix protein [Clostridium sporogenes ATCC 15579]KIS22749.1 DNA-binding protein [Clostridium botulinum B2 450]MCW7999148.1 transcriptional regulator [Clostridium sp. cpc1]
MKFGEFFKNIRTEKGLSQRQLAELSHISNTEISRIESGERRNPSPNTLKSLAPHLGISYGELMIKAGYIDESIEHEKYTEHIFRKADGELADTIRLAKTIHDKDSEILTIMNRVACELPKEDIKAIKEFANFYLTKNKNK